MGKTGVKSSPMCLVLCYGTIKKGKLTVGKVGYKAIQDVREKDMDMTGWLEYFVEGLVTQMQETVERGKGAIRSDLIVKQYGLKERQAKALRFFLENDEMHMRDMEALCPKVNRRTLQRDLQQMEALGIIKRKGVARKSYYVLGNKVQ